MRLPRRLRDGLELCNLAHYVSLFLSVKCRSGDVFQDCDPTSGAWSSTLRTLKKGQPWAGPHMQVTVVTVVVEQWLPITGHLGLMVQWHFVSHKCRDLYCMTVC